MYAVMLGERPAKPENAEGIGMTYAVWDLLRGCWEEERMTRPNATDVLEKFYESKTTHSTLEESTALPLGEWFPLRSLFRLFSGTDEAGTARCLSLPVVWASQSLRFLRL